MKITYSEPKRTLYLIDVPLGASNVPRKNKSTVILYKDPDYRLETDEDFMEYGWAATDNHRDIVELVTNNRSALSFLKTR